MWVMFTDENLGGGGGGGGGGHPVTELLATAIILWYYIYNSETDLSLSSVSAYISGIRGDVMDEVFRDLYMKCLNSGA